MGGLHFERLPGLPLPLLRGEVHPCPYLNGRDALELYSFPGLAEIDSDLYQRMMDQGFRRSGEVFYRPNCNDCQECRPIRVPVADFMPSSSQRRVLKRNSDVIAEVTALQSDQENYELYCRYQYSRHAEKPPSSRAAFDEFLGTSPIESAALQLRLDGKLICVSIIDICPQSISSVYCYFDPEHQRRSLGTLAALLEIELCAEMQRPWWYIGFYVRGCGKMSYKKDFRPYELLDTHGVWRRSGSLRRQPDE